MSQSWTDDVYDGSHVAQTDLQNMENNFACLKSMFSGGSAPSNTVAGMPWFDTTQKVLKLRNADDDGWFGIFHGDGSHKIWIYRNDAIDGWAIDSSVTDRVLALKGGSLAYNVSGGNVAGTWGITGLTHNHYHTLPIATWSGVMYTTTDNWASGSAFTYGRSISMDSASGSTPGMRDAGISTVNISSNSQWRPSAAVGTLQYLDL